MVLDHRHRAVQLFSEQYPHQGMRQRHRRKAEQEVDTGFEFRIEPVGTADHECNVTSALHPGCVRIALDERGKQLATADLSRKLAAWMQGGRDVVFMIGSADGLDQELKANADLLLSLSAMTLPHAMVRVLLAEQLYRAMSMIQNHPYHRE